MRRDKQTLESRTGEYLEVVLGIPFSVVSHDGRPMNMPYYLKAGNDFSICIIDGQERLMVIPQELPDGTTIVKRAREISQRTSFKTILVFENIDAVRRRVLVANRTDFIVPGKQAYLPSMGAVFTERGLAQSGVPDKQFFSPAAQVLLLSHLQRESLDGRIITEVAKEFPYSIKAVSAAMKELEQAGICSVQGDNSGKHLHFLPKAAIWSKAYPMLMSPIQEVVYCNNIGMIPDTIRFVTYDKALAEYTFVADFSGECFAVNKNDDAVKRLKNGGIFNKVEGRYRIELWKYNPALLAKSDTVDALSLALCYKDSDDERVVSELDEMVKKICKD